MNYKISDVVTLREFDPVISLEWAEDIPGYGKKKEELMKGYVITKEVRNIFEDLLESITFFRPDTIRKEEGKGELHIREIKRSFLITGTYGTGKSYLLSIASMMLESLDNEELFRKYYAMFDKYPEIQEQLDKLKNKKYFAVRINAIDKKDLQLKDVLLQSLRDELNRAGYNFVLNTEFENALRIVEHNESNTKFIKTTDDFGSSIEDIKNKLEKQNDNALEIFQKVAREVFGGPIDILEGFDLKKTLKDAEKFIKEEGYGGIIFYVDEFTNYLESSIEKNRINNDLGDLQIISEFANDKNDVWFIGAMHSDIEGVLKDKVTINEYEKIEGRFEKPSLSEFKLEELITAVVKTHDEEKFDVATRNVRKQYDFLNTLVEEYNWSIPALDVYPLHPAVVYYLPIFSRRFAQAERTAFHFIEHKINKIIEKPIASNDKLNLITLDELFDYFVGSIEKKNPELMEAYNSLRTVIKDKSKEEKDIDIKIIKTLSGLLAISKVHAKKSIETRISAGRLALYLNHEINEIEKSLKRLEKSDYLLPPNDKGEYALSTTALPNVDDKINECSQDIEAFDILKELMSERYGGYTSDNLRSYSKSGIFKVNRAVECIFYPMGRFPNKISVEHEAKLIFALPDFKSKFDFDEIYDMVRGKVKGNVVVAVPKNVEVLDRNLLKDIGAVEKLIKTGDIKDEREIESFRRKKEQLREKIDTQILKFVSLDNIVFINEYQDKEFDNKNPLSEEQISEIFDLVLGEFYPKFPEIKAEKFMGGRTTADLIRDFIISGGRKFKEIRSESDRHIVLTLLPMGIAKKDKKYQRRGHQKYILSEPDEGSPKEIWSIIDRHVSKEKPIEGLYETLLSPDYGLSHDMIEIYIAAYLGKDKAIVHTSKSHKKVDKSLDKLVKDITKNPENYHLIKTPDLDKDTKIYLQNLWKIICKAIDDKEKHYDKVPIDRVFTSNEQERVWNIMREDLKKLDDEIKESMEQVSQFLEDDTDTFEVLLDLKTLSDHINEAVYIDEVSDELWNNIENLTIPLISEHSPTLDDRYSKFKDIIQIFGKFKEFSKDYESIKSILNKINEISNIDKYAEIKDKKEEVNNFIKTNKKEIVLDKKKRDEFFVEAKDFWNDYRGIYAEEHDKISKAKENFGKNIIESNDFEFLEVLSQLNFEGRTTSYKIKVQIDDIKGEKCKEGNILRMLGDVKASENNICPECKYELGGKEDEIKRLNDKEQSILQLVINSICQRLDRVLELNDNVEPYLVDDKARGEWTGLIEKIKSIKDDEGYDTEKIENIKNLIVSFTKPINEYSESLADLVEPVDEEVIDIDTFLDEIIKEVKSQGVDYFTISEFSEKLKEIVDKLVEDMEKKRGSNARIRIH